MSIGSDSRLRGYALQPWCYSLTCCNNAATYMQVDVNTEVGVIHDYALRELRLFTDCGRTSRPLFIVEEGNTLAFKRHHLEALISRWVIVCNQQAGPSHKSWCCTYHRQEDCLWCGAGAPCHTLLLSFSSSCWTAGTP